MSIFEPTMNIYRCGCQSFTCNCEPNCPCCSEPTPNPFPPHPGPFPPPYPQPCPPPYPQPCPPPCILPCPPFCRTDYIVRTGNDAAVPQILPASAVVNVPDVASTLGFPTEVQEYGDSIVYNPSSKTFLLKEGYYLVTLRTTAVAPAVVDTVVYAGVTLNVGNTVELDNYLASATGAPVTNEVFINQFIYVPNDCTILAFYNNSKSQPVGTGSAGNTINYSNTTVNIVKLI